MPVSSEGRVALYLQDKHPIRDGMEFARHAERQGFEAVWQAESRLVREATVRRRHRADQGGIGRGEQLDEERGAARRHLRHPG
jgi:hypothetical protein